MNGLGPLLSRMLPRPRRPVTVRDAWPLILFLLLFAVLAFSLDQFGVLVFARPWSLGLAGLSVWVWWLHLAGYAGLTRSRALVALGLRLTLLGLLAMILAEPRAVRTRDVMSVMYLVDVSDSVRTDSVDAAMRYVASSAAGKPGRDEVGLLVFGEAPAVEQPPRMSYLVEALNAQVDRGATDIEQALSLAGAMLSDDNQGRIVLMSDGSETSGNLSRVLDDLKSRGISVDVLPIDYSYDKEVWVERIDLPSQVKLGETYEAAMVVSSLAAGEGVLTLRENGQAIAEQRVKFQPGKNRYVVPITLRAAGYYEYAATIVPDEGTDSLLQNNTALGSLFLQGQGQILLVTNPDGDPRDWQNLSNVIQASKRSVQQITARDFPADPTALLPYDCVIFCNVPYDAFDVGQLGGLKDAVFHGGLGFLMVGGDQSFGPGGWHRTVVEEMLPVTMDVSNKKVLPKGALAIILHTCEFAQGNTWAKRITKQAIKVLSAQDEAGLLAYTDQGDQWVFELTPASEYERLAPLIDGALVSDMPSFAATMELGLAGLKASDASAKHMIIISDGDPSPPTPATLQGFVAEKISVSTVAVFPHGGFEQDTMQAIAGATGGRYYFVNDNPDVLPSIFIKESKTLKRSMVQNRVFTPEIAFPSPVLKGLTGLPPLRGYVITNPKSSPAMTILEAPPESQDPSQRDPVLAIWQHGLGKTAAFTSDLSTNWAADWQGWMQFEAFLSQLLVELSRVNQPSSLRMSLLAQGHEARIAVEDFATEERFLDLQVVLSGPDGKAEKANLRQVAPRRYEVSVPMWGHGRYHAVARTSGSGEGEQAIGSLIVSYSPEYLRFRSNRQRLNEIADRTGGRFLSGDPAKDDVYHTDREEKRSSRPVFDWFLVALACLIPLDVAVRRIQIDWSAIRNIFRRRGPQEATATMSTLLKRKEQGSTAVSETMPRTATPRPVARPTVPQVPRAPTSKDVSAPDSPDKPAVSPSDASSETPMSTTERLLQKKRRKEQSE